MSRADDGFFVLKIYADQVFAQVFLNGAEMHRELDPDAATTEMKVSQWIVQGENRVRAFLSPLPADAQVGGRGRRPDFRVELIWRQDPELPGPESTSLVRYQWTPGSPALTQMAYTLVCDQGARVDDAFGRWSWQDAQPFTADEFEHEDSAVRALAARVNDALQRRDAGALLQFQRPTHEDLARAMGVTADDIQNELGGQYRAVMRDPRWSVDGFDRNRLRLQLQPNRRIVAVYGPEGGVPVAGRANRAELPVPIMAARVDGTWIVVR